MCLFVLLQGLWKQAKAELYISNQQLAELEKAFQDSRAAVGRCYYEYGWQIRTYPQNVHCDSDWL